MDFAIFPPVKRWESASGVAFDYTNRSRIVIPRDASYRLRSFLRGILAECRNFHCVTWDITMGKVPQDEVLLTLTIAAELAEEEYTLKSTSNGFEITGGSETALSYALSSFRQLVEVINWSSVPDFTIQDTPDIPRRGYMLDISRLKVPTMTELKKMIVVLSRLKYNELQLYTEHTFAFSADETVWQGTSPLSAGDILELADWCELHFIDLVPNQNSFGHLAEYLAQPSYRYLAECPDGYHDQEYDRILRGVLTPGADALKFLQDRYQELLPNFRSAYFNVGCDETFELGKGRSQKRCEEISSGELYCDFLLKILNMASEFGFRPMFWGDIILKTPELIAKLPPNVVALDWGYEADHDFAGETKAFADSGVPFYVCPGTSAWNTFGGRTDNMLGNLRNAASCAKTNGALGLLVTDWGDNGFLQYWPVSWAGLTAAAGLSWNVDSFDEKSLGKMIDRFWCDDRRSIIGDYLLELGAIDRFFNFKEVNSTIFFRFMPNVYPVQAERMMGKFTSQEVDEALKGVADLRRRFRGEVPYFSTSEQVIAGEFENTLTMIEIALLRMREALGLTVDYDYIHLLLRRAIARHRELWLERNHSGGLERSCQFLLKVQEELEHRRTIR